MRVARNDALTVDEVERARARGHRHLAGSRQSGRRRHLARLSSERFHARVPILGVCLGHQTIGQAFGGTVARARRQMHGKTSPITHDGRGVFAGLPPGFEATRYHSLVVLEAGLPADLEITARADDGEIMGLRHRRYPVEGVQFHPESILTGQGKALLANFLALTPVAAPA